MKPQKTFVEIGNRVTCYEDPFTMLRVEGTGTVVKVLRCSDWESALVTVKFDDDEDSVYEGETFDRWIIRESLLTS